MPEGHTLHRLARTLDTAFRGERVESSSPQGRFSSGADEIDGATVTRAHAYGKHLFVAYDVDRTVHVHLGLYGRFRVTAAAVPAAPVGQVRWRLVAPNAYADLRGATACEVLLGSQWREIVARLGPDPLRLRTDPTPAAERIARSKAPIAGLLMDQSVIAGIGNVYRAEVLFRGRIAPLVAGRELGHERFDALWEDTVMVMRAGMRSGRIVTTRPEHRTRRTGTARREDAHYVYGRTGLPCRLCGTPIQSMLLAARTLYWCPQCQQD